MTTFQIKKAGSLVSWTGKKVLGLHTGHINVAGGQVQMDAEQLTGAEIEIDMNSIVITDIEDVKTNSDFLTHLRNEDFFAVEKFPTSHLRILSARKESKGTYQVDADLTIKGITHGVQFKVLVDVLTDYLYASGEMVIDRTRYDIRYGSGRFFPNLGDSLIHDDFVLQFKIVAQKNN